MTLAKGHLRERFYFHSEASEPGCNADYHFGSFNFCLQKVSKFKAKTHVKNTNITLKSQDSEKRSGPNGPLVLKKVAY